MRGAIHPDCSCSSCGAPSYPQLLRRRRRPSEGRASHEHCRPSMAPPGSSSAHGWRRAAPQRSVPTGCFLCGRLHDRRTPSGLGAGICRRWAGAPLAGSPRPSARAPSGLGRKGADRGLIAAPNIPRLPVRCLQRSQRLGRGATASRHGRRSTPAALCRYARRTRGRSAALT
eukprot:2365393-Prymnesium_polylepis.1